MDRAPSDPTRQGDGYEDIAYSTQLRRFFLLIEAAL